MKLNSNIIRLFSCLVVINLISVYQVRSQSENFSLNKTVSSNPEIFTISQSRYLSENSTSSLMISRTDTNEILSQNQKGKIFYQGKVDGIISASIGLDVVNSISFFDIVAIGVGAGLRFPLDYKVISAPLYLDFRLTMSRKKIAPIIEAGWGGTFQPNSYYENAGQIAFIHAGGRIKDKNKFSYMITVGYEAYDIMAPSVTHSSYGFSYRGRPKKKTISSPTLNFGFIF